MRPLLFLGLTVAGLVAAIAAHDPFGWQFNSGLIAILGGLCGLFILVALRLRRSPIRWRRVLGTAWAILLLVLAALAVTLWSNYHLLMFRPAGVEAWRADLADLGKSLDALPEGLRERARACAVPELAALSRDLPSLSNDGRHVRLIHAIACLNDGHSIDFPFFPATDFSLVPLQIKYFDDGWFVTDAPSAQSSLVGLQVIHIDGIAAEDAYRRMRPYISTDNESAARVHAPLYLLSPRLWKAIEVGRSSDALDLDMRTPAGGQRQVRLFATSRLRYLWWYWQPRDRLFQRRVPWWVTPMPARKAVYVAFREVRNRRDETLTAFGGRLLRTARETGAGRIVIDVRDNSGGDNSLFGGFVSAMAASEYNARGRLFLLIDGGTFSAATNFVTTMERRTNAILVGTPTGSGPNHFGDADMLVLRRTHAAILLSTRRHQFGDPSDVRTAHLPQLAVPLTSRNYFAGRDAALEAALNWASQTANSR